MKVTLIRHGKTAGNLEKRYIGTTDEELCTQGIAELVPIDNTQKQVYVSPLIRTQQTATILYPNAEQVVIDNFREMDFGIFEGKNYIELADNAEYRTWVDGGCIGKCPCGESRGEFIERCKTAFVNIATHSQEDIVIIAHGGTIMAICATLAVPVADFYSYHIDNGARLVFEFTNGMLTALPHNYSAIP